MNRARGRRRRPATLSKLALAVSAALAGSVAAVVGGGSIAFAHQPGRDAGGRDASPIRHVIVIIGENHTFDNVFATYEPPKGQTVRNLRSEGIVTASGGPGPNVARAVQNTASDTAADGYQINPKRTGPYPTLPQPNTTYVSKACDGQASDVPDARFPSNLANAPYQITRYVPYFDQHGAYNQYGTCEFNGAYVGDPLHRFYQMYQQVSGGTNDLFTWVHETAGDANGNPPPNPFTEQSTNQGALDMGFYNMAAGDAPTLEYLARHYAMSDNYHQAVMGGTGANHIALGTGYAAYYQDGQGNPTPPPSGEIENPNAHGRTPLVRSGRCESFDDPGYWVEGAIACRDAGTRRSRSSAS